MLDNDDFITLSFLCYQGIETAAVDTFVVIRYSVVFDHLHIFKKLENTEIWEFRTLYNGICTASPTGFVGCAELCHNQIVIVVLQR